MTDAHATPHWPVEVRLSKAERQLSVTFDDGTAFAYPAEYLRVESPSAEVMGHGAGQRVIVPGRANVGISTIEAVGNYAIRIVFDDGHDTGIYSWSYLHELGVNHDHLWQAYEEALKAKNMSRDT